MKKYRLNKPNKIGWIRGRKTEYIPLGQYATCDNEGYFIIQDSNNINSESILIEALSKYIVLDDELFRKVVFSISVCNPNYLNLSEVINYHDELLNNLNDENLVLLSALYLELLYKCKDINIPVNVLVEISIANLQYNGSYKEFQRDFQMRKIAHIIEL